MYLIEEQQIILQQQILHKFQMNGTRKHIPKTLKARIPKKYVCTVKVGNNPDGTAKCLKYRLNDILKFTLFLDRKHPEWKWFNVYSKKTGIQLKSFTKHNRPTGKDG